MHIASIGIDIGKTTFHLVALNEHGSIVVRKRFSRNALLAYTVQLTPSLIGMESCGGAHFLARALGEQGQYSTGGKPLLLGISKRGNEYLRTLFVHGARAVLFRVKYDTGGLGKWVHELMARAPRNKVIAPSPDASCVFSSIQVPSSAASLPRDDGALVVSGLPVHPGVMEHGRDYATLADLSGPISATRSDQFRIADHSDTLTHGYGIPER